MFILSYYEILKSFKRLNTPPFAYAALILLTLSFSACSTRHPDGQAGKGAVQHIDSITLYCDEAFRFLMDQEIEIYEFGQPDQHIHAIYLSEAEVLDKLRTDSMSDAILGRRLHEQELKDIFTHTHIQADEHNFATDAIAIIANRALDRDTITYSLLLSLLNHSSADYHLVFEGNGSGTIHYMFAQHSKTGGLKPGVAKGEGIYATKNIRELIEYLQKDKKGIGFIPFARISDEYDTAASALLTKIKVLYISVADSTGRFVSSTVSQSTIADGSYPLVRPVTYISHSMEERVSTGFVNFLHREQSGRIILKAGLMPVFVPERLINVKTDPIK